MQRKFLILFIKYAKRGDLIHCTPDKTKKQSAGAERNFFVIKKFCVWRRNLLHAVSESGIFHFSSITINYFHNEQRCNLESWKKERFSAQYLFVIMILLTEVEQ